MTIFAHAGFSILSGRLLRKKLLNTDSRKWFLLFCLAGILPDLPLLLITLTGNFTPDIHHHEWITHAPFFWMVISLVIRFFNKDIASVVLIGTLSHLATDWYGGGDGIMFLWPYSHHQYGVMLSGHHGKDAFRLYFSNPVFLIMEVLMLFYLAYETYRLRTNSR